MSCGDKIGLTDLKQILKVNEDEFSELYSHAEQEENKMSKPILLAT